MHDVPTDALVTAVTSLAGIQERDAHGAASDGGTGDSGETNDGNFH
jgi:hypothetical protein